MYNRTCVLPPSQRSRSQGSSMPFCTNTRSPRRPWGVAAITSSKASLVVQTQIGPASAPCGAGRGAGGWARRFAPFAETRTVRGKLICCGITCHEGRLEGSEKQQGLALCICR
jgi:hypothetical protein